MRRLLAWALALLSAHCELLLADEASVQTQLVQSIRQQEPSAIQLLERAVNINSGTLNPDGVRAVGKLFGTEFEKLGFESTWIDGAEFQRAGHLVLERKGQGQNTKVLLIGHLDTVFERTHPFQRAERADAHTLRGPGTADMKGGIVVGLTALRALQALGALNDLDITLVLNGDEEDIGEPREASRAALMAAAKHADVALGLENAANDPRTAVVGRRSSSQWHLEVHGNTAHSSRIFSSEVGAGAAYELARILHTFYEQLHAERNLTFNAGIVSSGSHVELDAVAMRAAASGKTNIVAHRAVAMGDLRALTPEQLQRAVGTMQAIVSKSLPQTRSTLTFSHNYPPMPPTPGNERLLSLYDDVSRALGHGPVTAVDPARAGAADIAYASALVPMNLDGLGLLGGHAHTAEEFADLRTFSVQTQRLALLLYRLAQDESVRRQ